MKLIPQAYMDDVMMLYIWYVNTCCIAHMEEKDDSLHWKVCKFTGNKRPMLESIYMTATLT